MAMHTMMLSQLAAVSCSAHWVVCHAGNLGPTAVSVPGRGTEPDIKKLEAAVTELTTIVPDLLKTLKALESNLAASDQQASSTKAELKALKSELKTVQASNKQLKEVYHQMHLQQVKPITGNCLHHCRLGLKPSSMLDHPGQPIIGS